MSEDGDAFEAAIDDLTGLTAASSDRYLTCFHGTYTGADDPSTVELRTVPEEATEALTEAFLGVVQDWQRAATHPNVAAVRDWGAEPAPWVLVDVDTRRTLDAASGALPGAIVRAIVEDVSEALRNAGYYNLTHGDLGPAHVRVVDAERPTAAVDDWGLSRVVAAHLGDDRPVASAAPEQRRDDTETSTTLADVYGLGVLTYHALTGQTPTASGEPTPPSELDDSAPTALDDVVLRALAVDPVDRQDSPFEFKRAFVSAVRDDERFVLPDPASERGSATDGTATGEPTGGDEQTEGETGSAAADEHADESDVPPSDGDGATDATAQERTGDTTADEGSTSAARWSRRAALAAALTGTGLLGGGALGVEQFVTDLTRGGSTTRFPDTSGETVVNTDVPTTDGSATEPPSPTPAPFEDGALDVGGSPAVHAVMNAASVQWNGNRQPSSENGWPNEMYGIETDRRLADYWAGLYGEVEGDGDPPYQITVGTSDALAAIDTLRAGTDDIANVAVSLERGYPAFYPSFDDRLTPHVVGMDALVPLCSLAIFEAGIAGVTGDDLRSIFTGAVTNWSALGGPDRELQALAPVASHSSARAFRDAVFDDPTIQTQVANRYGTSQRLARAVAQADNAITYASATLADTVGLMPLAPTLGGTTYAPEGGAPIQSTDYPLSRDLHAYTWEGTSRKEAAFLRMILSEFGQDTFVAQQGFGPLSDERRQAQIDALPDTR